MAGPSRDPVIPSRNDMDDEEDFGFKFSQLNMEDPNFAPPYGGFSPAPTFVPRPFPNQMSHNNHGRHSQPNAPYPSAPQSPYLHHHPIPPQLQSQTPFIPYQHWGSPPMSPSAQSMSFDRARQGSYVDGDMGMNQSWTPLHQIHQHGYMQNQGNQNWTPPSAHSYQLYTPYQQFQPINGQTFSGQGKFKNKAAAKQEIERERKPYHPQPPAKRSDWVMWVGNVPQNTSHEELWRYFNSTIPPGDEPWKGPSSIFLISRSSCAFVNLSSQEDLDRAVNFFNGRPLRGWDIRCPRMVCRVRRKDDDLRAGVGAQRGTGMHREWIKTSTTPTGKSSSTIPVSPAAMEPPPEGEGRRRESIVQLTEEQKHRSTNSYASTNSSFLVRHFPKRVFILKSMTVGELEESVQTGTWRTQRHNEPVLDQAYRTAPEVFLIFGANKTGEFFGYAKMVEPIDKEESAKRAARKLPDSIPIPLESNQYSSQSSTRTSLASSHTSSVQFAPERPTVLSPSSSSSIVPMSSPGQLTPGIDEDKMFDAKSVTYPPKPRRSVGHTSIVSAPADSRPTTLDPKLLRQSGMATTIAALRAGEAVAAKQLEKGGSDRKQEMDDEGVLRKDTFPSPESNGLAVDDEEELRVDGEEARGHEFRIEWIRVGPVPFGRTRHLRNPWNTDREVKVSRDGTEVEPNVGSMLMAEWDRTA